MAASAVVKQKNVERLIASCGGLVSGKGKFQGKEWKLSQFVAALRKQISELERCPSVDQDKMLMFQQKVSVLEEVVRNSTYTQPTPDLSSSDKYDSRAGSEVKRTSTGGNPLLMRSFSQGDAQSRAELFAKSTDEESGPRYRGSTAATESESSEVAMERHRRQQEGIAEEMMGIARSLKDNALTAKNIITGDNQVLGRTNEQADQNIAAVERQTDRVKEHNRGCPWGTVLLLVLVFLVFLAMVFFIRIIPKPSS